jgi:hypothetical protein
MTTHSHSVVSRVPYEEEKHLDIAVTPALEKEHNTVVGAHRIFKWFGAIVSILLSVAALAPATFRIPENLQPWVFLAAVFWVLAFCSGMFDL